MKLLPFHPYHLREIQPTNRTLIFADVAEGMAQYYQRAGMGYTALMEGRPIGAAGILEPEPKTGVVWTYLSDEILQKPIWLCRTVRAGLMEATAMLKLDRLLAYTEEGDREAERWARFFGFEKCSAAPVEHGGRRFLTYERKT